jgi:hypothetical protein
VLPEDAGVELVAGADEELSDAELDFDPPSPDDAGEESLLEPEESSFELLSPEGLGGADEAL